MFPFLLGIFSGCLAFSFGGTSSFFGRFPAVRFWRLSIFARRRRNGRFGGQRALCPDASGAGLAGVPAYRWTFNGLIFFCRLTSGILKEPVCKWESYCSILEFGLPWPFTHVCDFFCFRWWSGNHVPGQIIATSHDLTPHGRVVGEPCLKWPYFSEIQVGEIL